MERIEGEISQDVINTLVSLTKNILGENAVNQILSEISKRVGESSSGKEIVFAFADEVQNMFGKKGGYAIIRQLGREVAKVLMERYPKEQWEEVLEKSLNAFGFAYKIERTSTEAYICNCVFYESILKPKNYAPVEHCVCWCGWGFIEAFVKGLEEGVKGIVWVDRDYENRKCRFVYIKD